MKLWTYLEHIPIHNLLEGLALQNKTKTTSMGMMTNYKTDNIHLYIYSRKSSLAYNIILNKTSNKNTHIS